MVNSIWRDDLIKSMIIPPGSFSEALLGSEVLFFRHVFLLDFASLMVLFHSLFSPFQYRHLGKEMNPPLVTILPDLI